MQVCACVVLWYIVFSWSHPRANKRNEDKISKSNDADEVYTSHLHSEMKWGLARLSGLKIEQNKDRRLLE